MKLSVNNRLYEIHAEHIVLDSLIREYGNQKLTCSIETSDNEAITITGTLTGSVSMMLVPGRGSVLSYRVHITPELHESAVESNLTISCEHPGARVAAFITAHTRNTDAIVLNTVQRHVAPAAESVLEIRGVSEQGSRMSVKSLIEIIPHAQQSSAHQKHLHLLVDKAARATSDPQLEVRAHEVTCSHGAAIGPVTPEHLFYLMSRGLSREYAREMVMRGFLRNDF